MMNYDVEAIRTHFPILERVLPNGKQLVYFDNAATTQKPLVVIDAMSDFYKNYHANAHRSNHTLADESTAALEEARDKLSSFFGASESSMIYTGGATEAMNLIAYGWARYNLEEGDVVVTTEMEHHANIVPWQELSKDIGIELRFVPFDTEARKLDYGALEVAAQGASLVCAGHVSNVLGVRNDVERIIKIAHSNGARVALDSAQGAPHEKINFDELGADFCAIAGHKMAGPTGIGCLLVKADALAEMGPFLTGGAIITSVTTEGTQFQDGYAMFETGTPRMAEAIGWRAAVEWLEENIDFNDAHQHIHDIASWMSNEMEKIPGITIFGAPGRDDGVGVVSFLHESILAQDMGYLLDAGGFAIRTGTHCAQPLLEAMGVASTNRASIWIYNTMAEAEAFIVHLRDIVDRFA
jgi:cysteine desulfurase/selenocysteine lyase